MNLKPMSLNKDNCKNNPYVKKQINYVSNEDYFIKLYLVKYDAYIQSHNGVINVIQNITDKSDGFSYTANGSSTYKITQAMKDYNILCENDKKNIQDFNDVLILGMLCEALCRVAILIKALTENSTLVDQFIKESLICSDFKNFEYQFEINRAIELLSKRYFNLPSFKTKNFILLGKNSEETVTCKARLLLGLSTIYIEGIDFEAFGITLPNSIADGNFHYKEFNYIYDAIVWFLLADTGFYLDFYDNFYIIEQTKKHILHASWLFDHIVFNPQEGTKLFKRQYSVS
ncbi:MAG: hypothetical protein HFE58_14225 [Firmicutes bacterium]|uniref:hypothetical protein n=1 Tax=Thomasclavelia cocleata TaxID=69824 RepID=UPI00272E224E|nr:hypothetical protein [Thomasclavelia cocleata]MCI9355902.1 hypothetical protein [Bacillota bacterium]